ncbi:MAG: HD domain-containing protein [Myxococcota bacterium]
MTAADQARLVEALRFALAAHGDQTRKGSSIPYASHLLGVAALVYEAGGDIVQAVAALLHDTLEDCPSVDLASIRTQFGGEVAEIVETCSDLLPGDRPGAKAPWGERKTRYLDRLASAAPRTQLVAACDKLHNLRGLVVDLESEGPETLERFTAEPAKTRWYYESAAARFAAALPEGLRRDFEHQLRRLAVHVPRAEAP